MLMRLAVVGATGMVGLEMIKVIDELDFPYEELILCASERSKGNRILNKKGVHIVDTIEAGLEKKPQIALFSAGASVSKEWAPRFVEAGCTVIDNSSAFRMDDDKKLIVPEINGGLLTSKDKIIPNPNCSTIQMVMVLAPLHRKYGLKSVVVSTYQSVSGAGKKAVDQLFAEREGKKDCEKAFPHKIDMNALPHIDVFLSNGYTKEEMKMVNESRKILEIPDLPVSATCVRLPLTGGHSEAVNAVFEKEFSVEEVSAILDAEPGVIVRDKPEQNIYPTPLEAHGKNDVFVGRIRKDLHRPDALNLWITADNLRKGAAANAVQIAILLLERKLV